MDHGAGGTRSASHPHHYPHGQASASTDPNAHWRRHPVYSPLATDLAYRKMVRQATAAICTTAGFDQIQTGSLETLSYVASAFLSAVCEGTKRACEGAGRTKAIPADVWVSLVDVGQEVNGLPHFLDQLRQTGNVVISTPKQLPTPQQQTPLQVGRNRPHPQYVAEFLPPFPDPHTYIRTEIMGEPETTYEKVREQAADVARENRRNLVDLMLRSHPNICLFREYMLKANRHAQEILEDRQKSQQAMKAAQLQALRKARMERELAHVKNDLPGDLGDDILEDQDENTQDSVLDNMSDEDDSMAQYDLQDNVSSMVRTKLHPYCFIIEPIPEFRPYLACLVSEDGAEEEGNVEGVVGGDTKKKRGGEEDEEGTQVVENAFLRPVRLPPKTEAMEM